MIILILRTISKDSSSLPYANKSGTSERPNPRSCAQWSVNSNFPESRVKRILAMPRKKKPNNILRRGVCWMTRLLQSNFEAPKAKDKNRRIVRRRFGPRKTAASSAFIILSADNEYDLYVQGNHVGSSSEWQEANIYNVQMSPAASEIVLAVNATNTCLQAGLIALIQLMLESNGCGPYASVVPDDTWRYTTVFLNGFQAPGFDDSDWSYAVVEYAYGGVVWGAIPVEALGTGSPFGDNTYHIPLNEEHRLHSGSETMDSIQRF
ncbi:hypothetical protein CPB84DRAFT_1785876 [Gymnopilus junonius]|uniref:Uncharacterized protein n=1 Tax=Gymnopilus junonius TaxID=109634 RepID=A0A9P5TJQ9_GYMJU|nr:hypothetical protein CPB84DRAFT_1785876 [Gymnopilus junonius]